MRYRRRYRSAVISIGRSVDTKKIDRRSKMSFRNYSTIQRPICEKKISINRCYQRATTCHNGKII
jgi:hypothetical protein